MSLEATKRQPISDGLRYRILKRDAFQCIFCGRSARDVEIQVDHLWPVVKGGGNEEWNLATCCKSCNSGKRAKAEPEFEYRYEFLTRFFSCLGDIDEPERRTIERISRKMIDSPLLWIDKTRRDEAINSARLLSLRVIE